MQSAASSHLTIPLSSTAHDWAQQFAAQQADPQKGKRVYLNTLAVWAVYRYLAWLQINADLEQSDSWNPELRALFDTADLALPLLGRVECCPVMPASQEFLLPSTPKLDRIGYVAVQFSDRLDEVQIIGFAPATESISDLETLPISALQPLDALLDRLSELETLAADSTPNTARHLPPVNVVNLGRWLQQSIEAGWQTVEELFGQQTPALAFRRAPVRRAKSFAIGQTNEPHQVALIVTLMPETSEQVCIHLQVCKLGTPIELPPRLQLRVLTGTGDVFREVTAEEADTFIQYEFTGQPGEQFSVELGVENIRITENFVI